MRILWIVLILSPQVAAQDREPLRLSFARAIELAVSEEGNTQVQLANEAILQARSRAAQARAALLPGFDAAVAYQNQTRNLAAFGLDFRLPIPGFQFPTLVGPFNIFDARVSATQSVFDFSSIRRLQASRAAVAAARSDSRNTQERVAAQVARAYMAALRAQADVEAADANVALAEAVLEQAQNQKAAGTGTGIEITRARVQLANERQRRLAAENARRRAHLELLRAIGLRLDTPVELSDRLEYRPADAVTLEEARARALKARPDVRAQREREENARLAAGAVRYERLPSVAAFADYGSIGTGIGRAIPTRTYGVSLRVPIFDGGRREARRAESASLYRAERIRGGDLKEQIELEVRLARDSLESADEQVKVAEEGLQLAQDELAQARRRFDAGVSVSLEVTDAQTRVARARENRISALYQYNLARVELAQAMGSVRGAIP
jgi:outer membrane protein TolC